MDSIDNIIIASDHAGVSLKREIKEIIKKIKINIIDVGTFNEDSVDYPDIVDKAINKFNKNPQSIGILICGTGIGMSIAANKHPKIHCALVHDIFTAQMAKAHNHVNVIALGARIKYHDKIEEIIKKFLDTKKELGRHAKRIKKIKTV